MSSLPKPSVIQGVFWASVRSWGVRATTLIVFLVLARLLSPSEIGVVMFILGWLALVGVFGDLGLAEYLVYNEAESNVPVSIWWFQMVITLLISGALSAAILFNLWQVDNNQPDAQLATLILILTLPAIAAIKVPEAILRRRMDFKHLAIRSLISIMIGACVAVFLAYRGFGLWSLVYKQIIEALCDVILFFYYSRWLPNQRPSFSAFKLAFLGGWGIVGSRILDVIIQKADSVIIGSFIGMQELGIYSIALRVFQVMNEGVIQPVSNVIASALGRIKSDKDKFRSFFLESVRFAALITIPIFSLGVALGGKWIPVIFGPQWQGAQSVFSILAITGLFAGISSINSFSLLAYGMNKKFMILMIVGAVLSVSLLWLFSPFGIEAVSSVMAIKVILILPLGLLMAKQVIHFEWKAYFVLLKTPIGLGLFVAVATVASQYLLSAFTTLDGVIRDIVQTGVVVLGLLLVVRFTCWKAYKNLKHNLQL